MLEIIKSVRMKAIEDTLYTIGKKALFFLNFIRVCVTMKKKIFMLYKYLFDYISVQFEFQHSFHRTHEKQFDKKCVF